MLLSSQQMKFPSPLLSASTQTSCQLQTQLCIRLPRSHKKERIYLIYLALCSFFPHPSTTCIHTRTSPNKSVFSDTLFSSTNLHACFCCVNFFLFLQKGACWCWINMFKTTDRWKWKRLCEKSCTNSCMRACVCVTGCLELAICSKSVFAKRSKQQKSRNGFESQGLDEGLG